MWLSGLVHSVQVETSCKYTSNTKSHRTTLPLWLEEKGMLPSTIGIAKVLRPRRRELPGTQHVDLWVEKTG